MEKIRKEKMKKVKLGKEKMKKEKIREEKMKKEKRRKVKIRKETKVWYKSSSTLNFMNESQWEQKKRQNTVEQK